MKRWTVLLLSLFLGAFSPFAQAADAKPKKKKAKKDAYENSKYKSYKVLTDDEHSYRFDERGNPILPAGKKKPAKKKKAAAPPEEPQEKTSDDSPGA